MFNFFKKKKNNSTHILTSPAKGKAVSLKEVNDPTFSENILGEGVAVIPEEGKIYAPCDGKIEMVFDTLHAVNMVSNFGTEILIHVGLDTVKLKGEGYESHVTQGQEVKQGDLLLTVDLEKLKSAGYDTITPMIICNTDDYASVTPTVNSNVNITDTVLSIEEKNN